MLTSTRASLVNEFIKHVLFRRQQIPMTYEQLKEISGRLFTKYNNENMPGPRHSYNLLTMKKVQALMADGDRLFSGVTEAFNQCCAIDRVLILLGGSIISPKETYIIHMPPMDPEVDHTLSLKACLRRLFRELFTHTFFMCARDLAPSRLTVMFRTARDANLTTFHTRPNYTTPTRGRVLHIYLETGEASVSQDLSSVAEQSMNISGIEPMSEGVDTSPSNSSLFSDTQESLNSPGGTGMSSNMGVPYREAPAIDEDFIWYQITPVVKGTKVNVHNL